jgi:hypothetical protein
MIYDIIIVGSGPSGLTMAHTLSSNNLNLKILVVDKNDSIGGCHRVKRINNYFTEHGPRIYSSAYVNFKTLLSEINVNFNELFTPYNFQFTTIGNKTIFSTMNFKEFGVFALDFFKLVANENYGKNISIGEHMTKNKFTNKSIKIIDGICRLTDGAGADRYTLNEFLQLFNQQLFYGIYQPKLPNDLGLFKIWKQFLERRNVDFFLETDVKSIENNENGILCANIINDNKISRLQAKKLILAIPPINFVKILEKSENIVKYSFNNIFGSFEKLKDWSELTKYLEYIQITFHWNEKIKLEKVYGFPSSEWGIAFIVLSDYMHFSEEKSKTVISTTITITDKKSIVTNKIPNQCTENEIIREVIRILRISFPNLPNPTLSLFNPNTKYINNKWKSDDTAFVSSSIVQKNIPFKSGTLSNLYNVGTHNGFHTYNFTSLESAVTNALVLSNEIFPELRHKYKLKESITIKNIVLVLFVIFILWIIVYYGK